MAIYCSQGSGTLRQQLLMMHGIALYCMVLHGGQVHAQGCLEEEGLEEGGGVGYHNEEERGEVGK